MERIAMSQQERGELDWLKRAKERSLTQRKAAVKMGVSGRWVRANVTRIFVRYVGISTIPRGNVSRASGPVRAMSSLGKFPRVHFRSTGRAGEHHGEQEIDAGARPTYGSTIQPGTVRRHRTKMLRVVRHVRSWHEFE